MFIWPDNSSVERVEEQLNPAVAESAFELRHEFSHLLQGTPFLDLVLAGVWFLFKTLL